VAQHVYQEFSNCAYKVRGHTDCLCGLLVNCHVLAIQVVYGPSMSLRRNLFKIRIIVEQSCVPANTADRFGSGLDWFFHMFAGHAEFLSIAKWLLQT